MVGLDQWSRREEGKARPGQGRAGQGSRERSVGMSTSGLFP